MNKYNFLIGGLLSFLLLAAAGAPTGGIARAEGKGAKAIFPPAQTAAWLESFRKKALAKGVSPTFFDEAFKDFRPLGRVIKSAGYQPEFKIQPGAYITRMLSAIRLERGKQLLREKAALLEKVERLFGVDRHILVAIWGVETNYGRTMGSINVVYALATLAVEGRRKKFAERQLLALLPILEKDKFSIDRLGSWAGAMGQMQFIPTTYADFARDVDGDGRRDIWNSEEDSLGSAAYYLKRSGWQTGMPWGIEVSTPADFSYEERKKGKQTLENWFNEGYLPAYGADARYEQWKKEKAKLVKVEAHSPAFLATKNFDVLLKYNNSTLYGLAIGNLADRLRGAPPAKTPWLLKPLHEWTIAEMKEIQTSLSQLGFSIEKIDGIIGQNTREAFYAWQKSVGIKKSRLTKALVARLNKQAATLLPKEIKQLQEHLTALGFPAGKADGLVGSKTRAALKDFQQKEGFVVDGTPNRAMLLALQARAQKQ